MIDILTNDIHECVRMVNAFLDGVERAEDAVTLNSYVGAARARLRTIDSLASELAEVDK